MKSTQAMNTDLFTIEETLAAIAKVWSDKVNDYEPLVAMEGWLLTQSTTRRGDVIYTAFDMTRREYGLEGFGVWAVQRIVPWFNPKEGGVVGRSDAPPPEHVRSHFRRLVQLMEP